MRSEEEVGAEVKTTRRKRKVRHKVQTVYDKYYIRSRMRGEQPLIHNT